MRRICGVVLCRVIGNFIIGCTIFAGTGRSEPPPTSMRPSLRIVTTSSNPVVQSNTLREAAKESASTAAPTANRNPPTVGDRVAFQPYSETKTSHWVKETPPRATPTLRAAPDPATAEVDANFTPQIDAPQIAAPPPIGGYDCPQCRAPANNVVETPVGAIWHSAPEPRRLETANAYAPHGNVACSHVCEDDCEDDCKHACNPTQNGVCCVVCGDACCDGCERKTRISFHGTWVRPEGLIWRTEGAFIPPLVTQSPPGTPREDAGVIGEPGTEIIFGQEEIFEELRWGGRVRFGTWFGERQKWGFIGEWFALSEEIQTFTAISDSNGSPIFARPFVDVGLRLDPVSGEPIPPGNNAELVSFPDLIAGLVSVDARTELFAGAAAVRKNLCCKEETCCGPCGEVPFRTMRLDVFGGWRYMQLNEKLTIREDLSALTTPLDFDIFDRFDTESLFHGADVGVIWELKKNRWMVELLGRIAVGFTRETVVINGGTIITQDGVPEAFNRGILTQGSNIGIHRQNEFTVIPELGATVGFELTPRLTLTAGYSMIYWSRVVRPGDQIDLDVNPGLFPGVPQPPPEGSLRRPAFAFRPTDFLMQGVNIGVNYSW